MGYKLLNGKLQATEDQIQTAFVEMFERKYPKLADCLYHPPQEGRRTWAYGLRLKRMGWKAGMADILLTVGNSRYHGLWIELKRPRMKQTPAQLEFQRVQIRQKYCYAVCYSVDDAMRTVDQYLKLK